MIKILKYKATLFGGMELQNHVLNGNFQDAGSQWFKASVTPTYANNIVTMVHTTSSGIHQDIVASPGDKIYQSWYYRLVNGTGYAYFRVNKYNSTSTMINDAITQSNTFVYGSRILTVSNDSNGYRVYLRGVNGNTTEFKDIISINLTATFGAGNEPNLAWCDANIAPFIVY